MVPAHRSTTAGRSSASVELSGDSLMWVAVDADALSEYVAEKVAARLAGGFPAAPPPWLDVDGAALHLGCSTERVRKLVQRRAIPFHQERPGARLFFNRRELDEWLCST